MSAPERRRSSDGKPSPRLRKEERKRQLLTHAKHLFVTLGYQTTTTEKIAQAAGITEPVLYQHFENKKTLFLEVLQDICDATIHRWRSECATVDEPLARLHAIVESYLGSTREHALESRIMHRTLVETDDAEILACLQAYYLESETLLADIIRQGQQTGVFRRSFDPRIGAWELIRTALAHTLTLPLKLPLHQEPNYLPHAIDCMLHCLLKTDV